MRLGLVLITTLLMTPAAAAAKPPGILGVWKLEIVSERYCYDSSVGEHRRFKITRYWDSGYKYRLSYRASDGTFTRLPIRPKGKAWTGTYRGTGECNSGATSNDSIKFTIRVVKDYMVVYRDFVATGCGGTARLGDKLTGNRANR